MCRWGCAAFCCESSSSFVSKKKKKRETHRGGANRTCTHKDIKSITRRDLPARETQQTVKAHLHLWEVSEALKHSEKCTFSLKQAEKEQCVWCKSSGQWISRPDTHTYRTHGAHQNDVSDGSSPKQLGCCVGVQHHMARVPAARARKGLLPRQLPTRHLGETNRKVSSSLMAPLPLRAHFVWNH